MIRKLALSAAILAATTGIAMADAAPYIGASTGVLLNSADTNIDLTLNTYRAVPFNLIAGFGGVIAQNFYLAGELQATLGTAAISNSNSSPETTYGGSLSVLPGFMINDSTLAFARLGVISTHFQNDNQSYQTGGLFGAGLQTALTQNLDVRAEYDYAAYKSQSSTDPLLGKITARPRSDQFTVGLIYKFD